MCFFLKKIYLIIYIIGTHIRNRDRTPDTVQGTEETSRGSPVILNSQIRDERHHSGPGLLELLLSTLLKAMAGRVFGRP